jgi:hypothetical protein
MSDFVTAINCIDGRVQRPVSDWMKMMFLARYVDTITEPGPDKVLTQGPRESVESIRRNVALSANAHGSRAVAIAGHHDCAANPVSKEEHLRLIRKAVEVVASWGLPVRVVGLWVNEWWWVELVGEGA